MSDNNIEMNVNEEPLDQPSKDEVIADLEKALERLRLDLEEAKFVNNQMEDQIRMQCAAGILASQSGLSTNLAKCIDVAVRASDELVDVYVKRIQEHGLAYIKAVVQRKAEIALKAETAGGGGVDETPAVAEE